MDNIMRSGWSSDWKQFLTTNKENFLKSLEEFYSNLEWTKELSSSQHSAWDIEYDTITSTLEYVLTKSDIDISTCWIAFEQELVGEGGKRAADVNLVLPTGDLVVIEFKHKTQASNHEIIRANFDLQTMLKFHSHSIGLNGYCFLALTKDDAVEFNDSSVICDRIQYKILPKLANMLIELLKKPKVFDTSVWQHGEFYRQPSILHGTVQAFFKEKMPTLKTEASINIHNARQELLNLYLDAKKNNDRYVVMVNGRPGAGKTLLGINIVADLIKDIGPDECRPLFLSGNGPLVQVLVHTLDFYGRQKNNEQLKVDGRSLIQDLIGFKKNIKRNITDQSENFVVFDEAQRAWEKASPRDPESQSELSLLCNWLSEKDFGVLLLLVGDGQAIHNNEMSLNNMLSSLESALSEHKNRIKFIMPSLHHQHMRTISPIISDTFYLQTPIRQAYTSDLDAWIEFVLNGDKENAYLEAEKLHKCYPLLLTKKKELAEEYTRNLQVELHKDNKKSDAFRAGWLMSSKGQYFLPIVNPKNNDIGPWYVEPPTSTKSCCQFTKACTEFSCQGLELSLALLNWGNDFLYRNGKLGLPESNKRIQEHYTYGSYRVLLSRGRSGLVIKCDDNETFHFLQDCGMHILSE